ncbi:MAG: M6 family metalloprotease domain-containing protein [Acidobacteriota bacterium]
MRRLHAVSIPIFVLFLALSTVPRQALSMAPPPKGEMQRYAEDGSLRERIERSIRVGNHRVNPQLVFNFQQNMHRLLGLQPPQGFLPPAWTGMLPATGNVQTLVLLVDFPDVPHKADQTVEDITLKVFGEGDPADVPYESLTNFYKRSSYGQLNISGKVLGWYRAAHERSYYRGLDNGADVLIKEILEYYHGQGETFSQYDNDNNGTIDGLFVKWTGPDNGWSGFWWAYQDYFHDKSYRIDGKHIGPYVWSWYENAFQEGKPGYHASTDIHETGHLFGLPDYYDYDEMTGPRGGVGELDMMDYNWGDHNCFSKFMLGWITPTVIPAGSKEVALRPSGTSTDAVVVMSGGEADPLREFFMVQYRKKRNGNDPGDYPTSGLLIWHVDAAMGAKGWIFQYDNSYTPHKLLRLMEADGLEQIENDTGRADAGDFYKPPKKFALLTTPNSGEYVGPSGILIDRLVLPTTSSASAPIQARFTVKKLDRYKLKANVKGMGRITSEPAGIECGNRNICKETFEVGTRVKLTAEPSSGYAFIGWGGACSGTGACETVMDANRYVSALFKAK